MSSQIELTDNEIQSQIEFVKTLQDFQDVSYIASGQNGSVFKAFSPSLGELAVKLVPEDKFKQKELDAARNLDQIRCEFFTRYLLITQNRPYIIFVMEYANSGTLANLIQEGTVLPEDRIREIFQQIFTGVGAMHEVGVIHRDLKPENVMLHRPQPDAPQVVKITDFGFSRVVENDGTAITRCCTPKYAAPELLFSNLPYSQKADIWSIGVMMFKSASGQLPYDGKSIQDLYTAIKNSPRPPQIPNVSNELSNLLDYLLNKDQNKRPKAKQALSHPFFTGKSLSSMKIKKN